MLDGTRRLHAAGEPLDHFYAQSSFATGAVVHERSAIPVPESLPYSVGALLGCSASTGVGAVRNVAGVESGQSVAVFGCGGVGASAILAADATSADPIVAVDVVPEKLDRMVALGATHVVDATEEDPVERVQDIAGGVEYALECSGSPRTIRQAHGSLRPGGTTVVTVTSSTGPVELDAGRFASGTSLVGNPVGAIRPSVDIPRYARMYRNDALDLDLLLSRTYELEELDEAFRALEAGEVIRSAIRFEE